MLVSRSSRQKRYARRKQARGICIVCTLPRVTRTRCEAHAAKEKEYQKQYAADHPRPHRWGEWLEAPTSPLQEH